MLTLPPKRRGREQAACWQLLRFAACLTRPDGTSARVSRQPSPVETTHPHRTEPPFGTRILAPSSRRVEQGASRRAPGPDSRHHGPMEIRTAEPGDRDAVVATWEAAGLTRPWNDPVSDFDRACTGQTSTVLVGTEDGTVIATVGALW